MDARNDLPSTVDLNDSSIAGHRYLILEHHSAASAFSVLLDPYFILRSSYPAHIPPAIALPLPLNDDHVH